jgi:hypothetical protein
MIEMGNGIHTGNNSALESCSILPPWMHGSRRGKMARGFLKTDRSSGAEDACMGVADSD